MPARKKATDTQLAASYAKHNSVWLVGKELGMCGQSVHQRLVKSGIINAMRVFTDVDKEILKALYHRHADTGTLSDLAVQLNRTKQFICRQARILGLTDKARLRPYLAPAARIHAKAWLAANPHPRGMMGKTHSAANKAKQAIGTTARWAAMTADEQAAQTLKGMKTKASRGSLAHPKPHGSWKADWRTIGGQRCYFRSSWEANYARYLEWLRVNGQIKKWEHEPETFWFEAVKRGTRSYLPDFRVTENSDRIEYHEVKGWMDDRSKTKIRRMAKYHPRVVLKIIDGKAYKALAKQVSRFVGGWE